jgi:hypothetical protein
MGELAEVSTSDRLEVRRLSSAILEAVRADESVARAAGLAEKLTSRNTAARAIDVYPKSDVEDLLTMLCQEVELLTADRIHDVEQLKALLELAMSKWISLSGNRVWGAQEAEERERCAKALGPEAMARITAGHVHNGPTRKA